MADHSPRQADGQPPGESGAPDGDSPIQEGPVMNEPRCVICGKPIPPIRIQTWSHAVTCSKACSAAWKKQMRTAAKKRWRRKRQERRRMEREENRRPRE